MNLPTDYLCRALAIPYNSVIAETLKLQVKESCTKRDTTCKIHKTLLAAKLCMLIFCPIRLVQQINSCCKQYMALSNIHIMYWMVILLSSEFE